MRSLALFLLLINILVLVWQLGFLPWLPWQAEQFFSTPAPKMMPTHSPTLRLLHETLEKPSTPTNTQAVSVAMATPSTTAASSYIQSDVPALIENMAVAEKVNDTIDTYPQGTDSKQNGETNQSLGLFSQLATYTFNKAQQEIDKLQKVTAENSKQLLVATQEVTNMQSKPLDARIYCYDIGPYANKTDAQHAVDWFKAQKALEHSIETRDTPVVHSTRVYLPPYSSRQAAREVEKRLVQQNINDKMIITQGKLTNGISLGVYRDQDSVERRLKQLKEKGYDNVQTEKMYKNATKYWITVTIDSQMTLIDTFKQTQQASSVASIPCK